MNNCKNWFFIYFFPTDEKNQKEKKLYMKENFGFMHYIAVQSTKNTNPDFKINFYTNTQPNGYYWDKVKDFVKVHIVDPPEEIYGNKIEHPAHKSDVFRLKLLKKYGGVYTDFDSITLQSFQPFFEDNLFKICSEKKRDPLKSVNIAGVVAPVPNSPYIDVWLDSYKKFSAKAPYAEFSCKKHAEHFSKCQEVRILKKETFYKYESMWKIRDIFRAGMDVDITEDMYLLHYWDSIFKNRLDKIDEKTIYEEDTVFNRLCINVIENKHELNFNKIYKSKSIF